LSETKANATDSAPAPLDYDQRAPFRPARQEPLLTRAIPVAAELPRYRVPSARKDAVAGVTVAALAIPAAMAYAEVAGVSPVNGLYALLLPSVAYALLGSSRQLSVGPDGSLSTLIGVAVLSLVVAGSADAAELAAMLAILVAICFAAAWVLRLGWIADYFSRPVLLGYIHGVAVVLIVGQLGKLLGLSIDARDPLPQLWQVITEIDQVSGATVAISAAALTALFGLRLLMPKLPAALLIVVVAIGLSWGFDFAAHDIAVVGPIPAGLPSFDVLLLAWPTSSGFCRLRSASSSSASPTRSSPRDPLPASTTRACVDRRSCWRWGRRTRRPASRRASPSERATRAPP